MTHTHTHGCDRYWSVAHTHTAVTPTLTAGARYGSVPVQQHVCVGVNPAPARARGCNLRRLNSWPGLSLHCGHLGGQNTHWEDALGLNHTHTHKTHTHHLLFSICTLVSYSVCVRGNPISPQPPFIVGHKRLSDCLWFMTTRLKVIAAARLLLYKKRYTMRGTMRLNEI